MTSRVLSVDVPTYRGSFLHQEGRIWAEKNCYVDLVIELLHSVGLEPIAAGAFSLSTDFEGDQWTFFKFPPEDLRRLFGIEIGELNIWRPVIDHVLAQLAWGRLVTVEVDSFFLPDTFGISYRTAHSKTTITPNLVDLPNRRMEYLHNAGYFELCGDDFDGLFGLGDDHAGDRLAPYVEMVKLDRVRHDPVDLLAKSADDLLTEHLARRPLDNPARRLGDRIASDLEWLSGDGSEQFHVYAFAMCRQFGACAELAADFTHWLADQGRPGPLALRTAGDNLRDCAEAAKSLQFMLARATRGRRVEVEPLTDRMAQGWANAIGALMDRLPE